MQKKEGHIRYYDAFGMRMDCLHKLFFTKMYYFHVDNKIPLRSIHFFMSARNNGNCD